MKHLWGRRLLQTGVVLLCLIGFLPIGHNLLVLLENIYVDSTLPPKVDGMIMLGGVIDIEASVARHQVQLQGNPGRMIEFIRLSQQYPQAKAIVSGGNGMMRDVDTTESEQTAILLKKLHVPMDKIIFEKQSRTTYENMAFSKILANPQAEENWLLITSAYHLPRAVAVFTSNGWPVTPIPAGYMTDGVYRFMPSLDVLGSCYKFEVAVKEIVGIIAYTLTERINTDVHQEDTP
ncbi:MAG: YdcF family protein, partial [Pseudomonadota bacterium]